MERVNRLAVRLSQEDRDILKAQVGMLKQHHDAIRSDKIKLHGKHGAMAMIEMRGALRAIMNAFSVILRASKS